MTAMGVDDFESRSLCVRNVRLTSIVRIAPDPLKHGLCSGFRAFCPAHGNDRYEPGRYVRHEYRVRYFRESGFLVDADGNDAFRKVEHDAHGRGVPG